MEESMMMNVTEEKPEEKLLPCNFKLHDFSVKVGDDIIICQIIKMEDCLYLWVGDFNKPTLTNLSFALSSNFEREPIAIKIMGTVVDATSTNMAKRLSMKLRKPVYVSFNVIADNIMLPQIEKSIQKEIKTHPDLLNF